MTDPRRQLIRMFLVLALLLGSVSLSLWWFPASWAWHLLRGRMPQVTAVAAYGTVWRGGLKGVSWRGAPLGEIEWQLPHAVLWQPKSRCAHWRWQEGQGRAIGTACHPAADRWQLRDVQFSLSAAYLQHLFWPHLEATGTVSGSMDELTMVAGWPHTLMLDAQWDGARLGDRGQLVALGALHGQLRWLHGTDGHADIRSLARVPVALHVVADAKLPRWQVNGTARVAAGQRPLSALLQRLGWEAGEDELHWRLAGNLLVPH